jgi:tRNA A-37 threonylcarbamoyl transferase component Bud32
MLTTTGPRFVAIGDIIADKYRVERILGIGGMGMVVAATHLVLGQEVAIKLMLPTANANAAGRFVREAQAVVRLRSEHICRVLDVGTFRETPYMVMELLAGCDLSQELARRHSLPLVEVVDTMMQALEALAEAHAFGIVHRDLKPANLFVTKTNDGSPLIKLLDFGISKLSGGSTRTSEMMGTPSYMAPEQIASAKNVDQRADVWAMGVIAYEAITGQVPFLGETLPATVMAVIQAEPPPLTNVPVAFARTIARCLAKHPDHRFADVAELAMAIAPFGSPASIELAYKIGKLTRPSARVIASPVPMAIPPMPTTLGTAAAMVGAPSTTVSGRRLGGLALVAMIGAGLGVGAATKLFAKGAPVHAEPAVAMVVSEPPRPAAPQVAPPVQPAVVVVAAAVEPAKPVLAARAARVEHRRVEFNPEPALVIAAAPVPVVAAPSVAPVVVAKPAAPPPPLMPLPVDERSATLEPAMISEGLASVRANIFQVCGHDQELHGQITFHVVVAPDGVVDSIVAAPTSLLGKCVIGQLQHVKFAVTQRGGAFEKTFVF